MYDYYYNYYLQMQLPQNQHYSLCYHLKQCEYLMIFFPNTSIIPHIIA